MEQHEKVEAAGGYRADSSIQAGGGHPGHLAGGAEMMWILNSQLLDGVKRLNEETEKVAELRKALQRELDELRTPGRVQYR